MNILLTTTGHKTEPMSREVIYYLTDMEGKVSFPKASASSLDLEPINELHRKIQEKLSSMISAKDLRIGNKIQVYNDICDVTDIEADGTIGTTAYFDGRQGCCGCTETMAQGIPLTIEWLHKCGFTFENHIHYNGLRLSVKFVRYDPAEPFLQLDSPFGSTTLKFVHQLQNWFFALTGEELIVKL